MLLYKFLLVFVKLTYDDKHMPVHDIFLAVSTVVDPR
jgi:hypothetical protein